MENVVSCVKVQRLEIMSLHTKNSDGNECFFDFSELLDEMIVEEREEDEKNTIVLQEVPVSVFAFPVLENHLPITADLDVKNNRSDSNFGLDGCKVLLSSNAKLSASLITEADSELRVDETLTDKYLRNGDAPHLDYYQAEQSKNAKPSTPLITEVKSDPRAEETDWDQSFRFQTEDPPVMDKNVRNKDAPNLDFYQAQVEPLKDVIPVMPKVSVAQSEPSEEILTSFKTVKNLEAVSDADKYQNGKNKASFDVHVLPGGKVQMIPDVKMKKTEPVSEHMDKILYNQTGTGALQNGKTFEKTDVYQTNPKPYEVIEQIARATDGLTVLKDTKNVITVQLKPESLGTIRIEVKSSEKGCVAVIYTQKEEVRRILEKSTGEITTLLADKTGRLEKLSVEPLDMKGQGFGEPGSYSQESGHFQREGSREKYGAVYPSHTTGSPGETRHRPVKVTYTSNGSVLSVYV